MSVLRLPLVFFLGCAAHSWLATSVGPLVGGVVPHLLILLTLGVSMIEGRVTGEVMGFCWGFYLDTLAASLFGVHCLLFTVLGRFAGNLRRHMDVHQAIPVATVASLVTVAYFLIRALFGILFTKQPMFPEWRVFLGQPILNAVFSPVVLFAIQALDSRRRSY